MTRDSARPLWLTIGGANMMLCVVNIFILHGALWGLSVVALPIQVYAQWLWWKTE